MPFESKLLKQSKFQKSDKGIDKKLIGMISESI